MRPAALFLLLLTVYLLVRTKDYYWDGIASALVIEHPSWWGTSLTHRHHLLYNVVGHALYQFTIRFRPGVRALDVLQILNAVTGALSACVMYRILIAVCSSVYVAWSLTALFAFSATWWKFTTDAASYIPSIFFALVSFYLVLPGRRPRPLLVACAHSLAMLFHQLAVLLFPVVLLGLWFQGGARLLARYGTLAFFLTISAYGLGFYQTTGQFEVREFLSWISGHSPDVSFSFDVWRNLTHTLLGNIRSFAGGRISLLAAWPRPWGPLLAVLFVAAAAAAVAQLVRYGGDVKLLASAVKLQPVILLCLVWIAVYSVFLFFYLPHNTFYRLFYLPAIILLAGAVLCEYRGLRRRRTALLVGALVVWNWSFFIFPHSQVKTNQRLELALQMQRHWKEGAIVYQASFNTDNWLFFYFNPPVRWRNLRSDGAIPEAELREIYDAGGSAWIDVGGADRILSRPGGEKWLSEHTQHSPKIELVNRHYRIRFVQLTP